MPNNNKYLLFTLPTASVLSRKDFIKLNNDEMTGILADIAQAGKPLMIVDDAEKFFTMKTLRQFIQDYADSHFSTIVVDGLLYLMAGEPQQNGINDADAGDVIQPVKLPLVGVAQGEAEEGVVVKKQQDFGGYPFLKPPEGFSVNANMSLGATRIRRKIESAEGDSIEFYLSPVQYELLWLAASKYWAKIPEAPSKMQIGPIGKENLVAIFYDQMVHVNKCILRRYEMEQVAKHKGWKFPGQPVKVAA
jgi:hypothetical protein